MGFWIAHDLYIVNGRTVSDPEQTTLRVTYTTVVA